MCGRGGKRVTRTIRTRFVYTYKHNSFVAAAGGEKKKKIYTYNNLIKINYHCTSFLRRNHHNWPTVITDRTRRPAGIVFLTRPEETPRITRILRYGRTTREVVVCERESPFRRIVCRIRALGGGTTYYYGCVRTRSDAGVRAGGK